MWEALTRQELESRLSQVTDAQDRIDLMNLLAYKLSSYDHKKAEEYATQARDISDKKYNLGYIEALNNLGLVSIMHGNMDFAKETYDNAKEANSKTSPEHWIAYAESYNGLGRYYQMKGMYNNAIIQFLESEKILKEAPDNRAFGNCYFGMGVLYFYDKKTYQESLNYFTKSMEYRKKNADIDDLGISYYALGEVYQSMGEFEKAQNNFTWGFNAGNQVRNDYIIANVLQSRGDIYQKQSKTFSLVAMEYFKKSKKLFEDINDKFQIATINLSIGTIYKNAGKFREAISYLDKSLKLSEELENSNTMMNSEHELATAYRALRDKKMADSYASRAKKRSEQLGERSMLRIHLTFIQKENAIADANRANSEAATSKAIAEKANLQKHFFIISFFVIIFFLLIVLKLYFRIQTLYSQQKAHINQITHDINNPLAVVLGYASILNNPIPEDKRKQIIEKILYSSQRIKKMVESILRDLKKDRRKNKVELNVFDLTKRLIDDFLDMASFKHIKLTFSGEGIYIVKVNENDLSSVIDNLISNAIKYTQQNKSIHISINKDDTFVYIRVTDEGIGLDEAQVEKILKGDLSSVGNKPTYGEASHGDGLKIAKKLLAYNKGTLNVSSDGKDKGSTFSIRLPLFKNKAKKHPLILKKH